MASERRRSAYTDKSTRNYGDQPVSPPSDTSLILSKHPKEPPRAGPAPNYRKLAREIAFSFSDSSANSSQISNDPYASELAATWNYHGGRKPKLPSVHEPQASAPVTHAEVPENSAALLKVEEKIDNQSQPACVPREVGEKPVSFEKRQMLCAILSVGATLGYLLVLIERLGLAHFSLLQGVGPLSILLSGLPGICLTCMFSAATVCPSKRKAYDAGSFSLSVQDPIKRQTEKSSDDSEAFQELRTKLSSNTFKTLLGFVLWDLVKAYTSLWPLLHLPRNATHEPLQEPPFFGQSPEGAKAGIHGYPPRIASGHDLSLPFSPLCQLLFPLVADGLRLVGLWFAFKTMRRTQRREKPGTTRLLHQSFWVSECMQPFTGLMPLVGEQATALSGLLLRCHSIFLGLAAAFTGCILASAFHRLFLTNAKSISAVLAAAASLAFCSCILFDVLSAAVPSSVITCAYTPFIADMRSGFVAVKAFAMTATLSDQVGQICLSLSAVMIKPSDVFDATADPQKTKEAEISRVPAK
ncbi:LOW QUALITY PROTEIN: uncharacterized protein EMH_0021390 [Eimeria mitis]|uniref:Uncharacterized protein n=1 Tax=Eimeria mitis TaxID=44415 RepID=U6KCW8_9EIME|nr:LOW QUALITY PROTEIN: uncharacterized protein EMH_0021390 [Eimeria mitis]CDJ34646.1 hypothetical protein, conserved [Eimeria mitis]